MHQDESSYFWKAKQVSHSQATDIQAFVELVGGVSSSERAFDANGLVEKLGAIEDELTGSVIEPTGEERLTLSPMVEEVFGAGTSVQVQALTDQVRDVPFSEDGLIVSPDGLHWLDPTVAGVGT